MALVKSQCCLRGDVSLLETTELLTKLPPADLLNIMSCKVTQAAVLTHQTSEINILKHGSIKTYSILHLNLLCFFCRTST